MTVQKKPRYVATAYYLIPLDDAEAEGNMGLQGLDEDGKSCTFPSRGLGVGWLTREFRAHRPPSKLGWAQSGRITRESWDTTYECWIPEHEWHYESPFAYAEPPGDRAVPTGECSVA